MTNSYRYETWRYFEVCCISPSCTADAVRTNVHLWQSWIWQQSCCMNKLCEHIWELRLDIILKYSMLKNITDVKCYKYGGLKTVQFCYLLDLCIRKLILQFNNLDQNFDINCNACGSTGLFTVSPKQTRDSNSNILSHDSNNFYLPFPKYIMTCILPLWQQMFLLASIYFSIFYFLNTIWSYYKRRTNFRTYTYKCKLR